MKQTANPEIEKRKLREKNFAESKLDAFHPKYGLFSFAGTLAILPTSYEQSKSPRRDTDGKVKTSPRNIAASPTKTGKGPDAYFSIPGFLSVGDKYQDPWKNSLKDRERAKKMHSVHDAPFKYPGSFELVSAYEHMSEYKPTKRTKSTCPRGFLTSPSKKGSPNCTPGLTFSEYGHIPDPIRLKKPSGKSSTQEGPPGFKPTGNTPQLFDDSIYTSEGILAAKKVLRPKLTPFRDPPFKPSNPTKHNLIDALFSKYEYIPPRSGTPKINKTHKDNGPWKPSTRNFSTPTPPVTTMLSNLKKEFKM